MKCNLCKEREIENYLIEEVLVGYCMDCLIGNLLQRERLLNEEVGKFIKFIRLKDYISKW